MAIGSPSGKPGTLRVSVVALCDSTVPRSLAEGAWSLSTWHSPSLSDSCVGPTATVVVTWSPAAGGDVLATASTESLPASAKECRLRRTTTPCSLALCTWPTTEIFEPTTRTTVPIASRFGLANFTRCSAPLLAATTTTPALASR
jgi:hypothetical protein